MLENVKLDKNILFPYLKSKILEKIVSDEFLITSQDEKDYKKVQDKSNECEMSIKTTLSKDEFSKLEDKIKKDLEYVKRTIESKRKLLRDKVEGRLPDGAADLGLLMQIFDRERVIERAFFSTLIFLKHDFSKESYILRFLRERIEKYKITDKDILNFYKDLEAKAGLPDKTKDDLPESYLRQYIKVLLENKIYL